jgi:glycine/D-amino acid oxidase-like deaminating enzyme
MPRAKIAETKLTIVGGGIIGAMEAYQAFQEAKARGEKIRITIYEKNPDISGTTSVNIAPSLTPDELLSVVPRGKTLLEKLGLLFSEPGGIRVDDVAGVNGTAVAGAFIEDVEHYGDDAAGHEARTRVLLELGKRSMDFWQALYDEADADLKAILEMANFNPCREPADSSHKALHKGYRIDLISGIADAAAKAEGMKRDYQSLGYASCGILSPAEVVAIDPSLVDFCESHSEVDASGTRQWKSDAVGLWRPGGCIDTKVFLPLFYEYLRKAMGQYTGVDGRPKDFFHLKFNRNVDGVVYAAPTSDTLAGVRFFGGAEKSQLREYSASDYVFCPGEAVGTLGKLGFREPSYAGFAGASLKLTIPMSADDLARFEALNHCMEVHKEGIVLAWQARVIEGAISIAVAGTKAFYSDVRPGKDEAFARDRNLVQLNMINEVLPQVISIALHRDTRGETLTAADLAILEEAGIAKRWVGVRAVAYDGFPTVGTLFSERGLVRNARCTTGLGSGGVSFAPAIVAVSRKATPLTSGAAGGAGTTSAAGADTLDHLTDAVLDFGSSTRLSRA